MRLKLPFFHNYIRHESKSDDQLIKKAKWKLELTQGILSRASTSNTGLGSGGDGTFGATALAGVVCGTAATLRDGRQQAGETAGWDLGDQAGDALGRDDRNGEGGDEELGVEHLECGIWCS